MNITQLNNTEKENIIGSLRKLNIDISFIWNTINQTIIKYGGEINFEDIFGQTTSGKDVFQVSINIEMLFIKFYVFQEYLKILSKEPFLDTKMLNAGYRAIFAHSGTQKEFHDFLAPATELNIFFELRQNQEGDIICVLKSGNANFENNSEVSNKARDLQINISDAFRKYSSYYESEIIPLYQL